MLTYLTSVPLLRQTNCWIVNAESALFSRSGSQLYRQHYTKHIVCGCCEGLQICTSSLYTCTDWQNVPFCGVIRRCMQNNGGICATSCVRAAASCVPSLPTSARCVKVVVLHVLIIRYSTCTAYSLVCWWQMSIVQTSKYETYCT